MNEQLKEQWVALRAAEPKLRIRDAAQRLGVSEVELLATRTGQGVTRLRPEHRAILEQVTQLGRVMALTRNNDVVHERKGEYQNPSLGPGPVGLFVGAEIDLRIFWGAWSTVFAVEEPGSDGTRHSLQFFATDGEAIHKIYLLPESNMQAYHELVERFRAAEQHEPLALQPAPAPHGERPDAAIDVDAFRNEWLALKDTHDFHGMLRKHGVTRTQALRLAPEGLAVRTPASRFREVVTAAANEQVPIMVFVGNKGMIQIHSGVVTKLMDIPGWFNVLDPDFNLHVREAAIHSCWVVRKPSVDGTITAIECFDDQGEQIVQLFGKRKPGIPELASWRSLVGRLEQAEEHA
jgi:putative hemin transport protein